MTTNRDKAYLYPLVFAAVAIAVRLPFLLSGKIPFDSDEAVEGLMARHVLGGELPAFFWGQAYKGVPEVYVSAAAFALFGSTVTVLKSITLAFFAAYVALNYVLVSAFYGRWTATAASLLLSIGPPPLVFWTLSASAEYVLVMLLGTIFLLLCARLQNKRSDRSGRGLLTGIGLVAGMGLWIHQMFLFYVIPVLIIFGLRSEWWRRRADRVHVAPSKIEVVLWSIAGIYLILAILAFFSGGFALDLGPIALSARAPQKMLRIAIGVAFVAVIVHLVINVRRDSWTRHTATYWPLVAGFLVGYSPVLLYSVLVEPARSPARVATARTLMEAAPDIFGNIIPILAGFKLATLERLPIPWALGVLLAAVVVAYAWSIRPRLGALLSLRVYDTSLEADFFPLFFVIVPFVLIVSGAYIDTQSYRYGVIYYAGLAVALAAGSAAIVRHNTTAASVLVVMLLTVFGVQQIAWYRKLSPDLASARAIDCLRREGIRGGYADYWTSYKLTFLSNEAIIFAPTTGVDRYPSYSAFVRSLPHDQQVAKSSSCVVSQ